MHVLRLNVLPCCVPMHKKQRLRSVRDTRLTAATWRTTQQHVRRAIAYLCPHLVKYQTLIAAM